MDAGGYRVSRLRQRVTAVIIEDDRIFTFRRVIYETREGVPRIAELFWIFPGGGAKPRETLVMGLHRETPQETGIRILDFTPILSVWDTPMPPGYPRRPYALNQDEHYYLITKWEGVPRIGEEFVGKTTQFNQYEPDWVPLRELLKKPNLREREGPRKLVHVLAQHFPPRVSVAVP